MALKGVVKRVNSHVPVQQLGEQSLLFADWSEIKTGSTQIKQSLPLAKILGEAPGLDSLLLGSNMTERFFKTLAQAPANESKAFVLTVTKSLAATA